MRSDLSPDDTGPAATRAPTGGSDVRVCLVEDEDLMRALLEREIERAPGVRVVESWASALEARRGYHPGAADILVSDINLPDGNGIALSSVLQRRDPELRVLLLSSFAMLALARQAHHPTAQPWSYLSKRSSLTADGLARAIRATAQGRVVIDPAVAHASQPRDGTVLSTLSESQLDVLRLVVEGLSNQAVAERLGLTRKGVEYHLGSIYRILGVNDHRANPRVAAVLAFLRDSGTSV
ncbi:response regulator [Xylanimonas ulmi]|uniref:DNA-binding NarL/FixJ family response regulator n=1 Tax=Xylanimonas ulmi TaxID=228973 RepID=A0A4Q7M372_9MICO|nr:response regulator transcription factor [Xylanibacterium ulmi]RZS62345.1 DNA-binding NarL/FixJ family response regulator [Xylanibacterium ulmi]